LRQIVAEQRRGIADRLDQLDLNAVDMGKRDPQFRVAGLGGPGGDIVEEEKPRIGVILLKQSNGTGNVVGDVGQLMVVCILPCEHAVVSISMFTL
jgi:hypothetical protein